MRPRIQKRIHFEPNVTYFKPQGVPMSTLENVELNYEELEALRLANIEKLDQTSAAKKMDIHQSTFQRTLTRAKEKITDALVNGKSIKINGGNYKMANRDRTGPQGKGPKTGRQMGNCEDAQPIGQGMGQGRGQGRGMGLGRGFANRVNQNVDQEKEDLKAELKEVKKRLEELEK